MRKLTFMGVVAALAIAGCNSEDASNLGQDAKNVAQHAGQAIGGVTLATKVNTALGLRKNIDIKGLHIEAKDGVVTVGGHVSSREEKQRVLDTVDNTVGVDTVIDQLRVEK
jgi:osmotically-inducible protein OsmY